MADTFTTVTSTSYFGRIRDALVGFIVGPLLLIGAVILIFWNESHSVRVIKSLKEGAANVVEVANYDSENDGELVHVTGETASGQTLTDPKFGVTSPGIRLNRNVRVYAWTEKESSSSSTGVSGTKTTKKTYTYDKKWVSSLPKSSHFKQPDGHENPTELKYKSASFPADKVTLGSYTLDPELVGKINETKSVPPDENSVKLPEGAKLSGDSIYIGADPENPVVGDLRITETVVPTGTVSIVAAQGPDGQLTASDTDAGEKIALVESGTKSAAEMFQNAQAANRTFTWVARLGGFLLLLFGFLLFLGPVSTMSSIVPFFGGLVVAGLFVASLLGAVVVWTLLVAAAWMVARPLVGVALVAVSVAAIFLVVRHVRRGVAARRAKATAV